MTTRRTTMVAILAAAVALAMGTSVRNGFVFDDVKAIVENPHVTDPSQWHLILRTPYWQHTLWRPLTTVGFALQWALGGGRPWLFHLVSLLAYLAVGMLLIALLRRLGVSANVALATAVLFVVHPVHVEVVANVVGQAELWTAAALLGSAVLYLRARDRKQLRSWRGMLPLVLTAAAGMMAKEQGYVVVFLLAGLEWLLPGNDPPPLRERLRPLLPIIALTALMLLVRNDVTGSLRGEVAAPFLAGLGIGGRVLTFLAVVAQYARLLLWPAHLQALYSPPMIPAGGAFGLVQAVGLAAVLLVIGLFLWCRTRAPVGAFGLWWAMLTLAPVSNLVVTTGLVMGERVFFQPTIGFAILAAVGGGAVVGRFNGRWVTGSIVAMAGAWALWAAARSARRVPVWHDDDGFFTQLTTDAPTTYLAALSAGGYWKTSHRDHRAELALRESIRLWPGSSEAYIELGQLLRTGGRCGDAVPVLEQGLRIDTQTSMVRAMLVECQITLHEWDAATATAEAGIAQGHPEFRGELDRIRRAETAADGAPATARRGVAGGG